MTVNCFQISSGPQLKPCEYSFAVNEVRQKNSRIWIDSMDADTKELEAILDDMDVQGLTRLFCLESRDHPGLLPHETSGPDGNARTNGSSGFKCIGLPCPGFQR